MADAPAFAGAPRPGAGDTPGAAGAAGVAEPRHSDGGKRAAMTLAQASLLLDHETRGRVFAFLEPRAAAIDAIEVGGNGVRDALQFLSGDVLGALAPDATPGSGHDSEGGQDSPNADLVRVAETIATAAWSDMTAAFSLWCHRMVLEYLSQAPASSALRQHVLPRLLAVEWLGSTALAAAMAHHVSGAPLPVSWRRDGNAFVLDGRVTWASNLFPPDFVLVTAAAHVDGGNVRVFAMRADTPGLSVQPYPRLLALQGTGSSSLALRDVRLTDDHVVAEDATAFLTYVRPTFLLLQSSFCWGLAARSLDEARRVMGGVNEVFGGDLAALQERATSLAARLRAGIGTRHQTPIRQLVQLRLDCAQFTTAAVALEAKAVGGRGYVVNSPTARRLREAAFLPIQAPTEGQLRWELLHCA